MLIPWRSQAVEVDSATIGARDKIDVGVTFWTRRIFGMYIPPRESFCPTIPLGSGRSPFTMSAKAALAGG